MNFVLHSDGRGVIHSAIESLPVDMCDILWPVSKHFKSYIISKKVKC
jgi:hypothetical protein